MGIVKSQEERIAYLKAKYPALDFSKSVYAGCRAVLTAVCPRHGEVTKTNAHWNTNGCPKCGYEKMAKPNKARVAGFARTAAAKLERGRAKWAAWLQANTNFESDISQYTGMEALVSVMCRQHGYIYDTRPATLIKQNSGCKFCGLDKLSAKADSPAANLKKARQVHGDLYTYPQPILRVHTKVEIICKEHGVFIQDFHNHLAGSGCPRCSHRISKPETEIVEWLCAKGAVVEQQNRRLIAPAELDIWLPEQRIAIEFNGAHWHADDQQRKNTALTKYQTLQAQGVRLISIFDFEWQRRRNAVENILEAAIGQQAAVGGRQVSVKPITAAESRVFMDQWHISGFVAGQAYLGLFHKNALIGAATFGKSRFEADTAELLRYATSCHVIGGLPKIIKAGHRSLEFEKLVSYCDLRFGTGKSYAKAGFTLVAVTPPDYWWFKKNLHFSRYQTQKHKLEKHVEFAAFYSDRLTEREICEAAGFRKITGVGHQKWEWQA